MLSYRHGFHAGNAADVLKHSVLIFCLEYLTQKEKPLLCVDTHAGAGLYPLREGFAAQNREWENGVGKLMNAAHKGELCAMLRRYLELCVPAQHGGILPKEPDTYPGSPLIMARVLAARLLQASGRLPQASGHLPQAGGRLPRPADRLVCFELHPADYKACKANLKNSAELRQADGFAGLKALLPPPSRRGLIFIDPPYEVKDDYTRLPETIADALKRFPSGTYIIWYPLLQEQPAGAGDLPARLMDLYQGNRCRAELYTSALSPMAPEAVSGNSPRKMYGSGLVIYNPPWTLKAALEETLPVLGALIGTGNYVQFKDCNVMDATPPLSRGHNKHE
ncbi:ribosomal RNA large subunit methyltransferase J [Spirochaetia bacterium]|nr:ribosomal RNA large subunit methyltransferase J [Spirochaetia bacterium]